MMPAKKLYDHITAELLAATAKLGGTFGDIYITTITSPFVPSVDLLLTDITSGTGDLAPIGIGAAMSTAIDPATGQWKIVVTEPIGGFKWVAAGTAPPLPVTLYGFALFNDTTSELLATWAFDVPLIVSIAPAVIEFHMAEFLMLNPPLL